MDQESPTRAADSRDPALLLQSRAGFDHRAAVLPGLLAAPLIVIILMLCKNVYIMAKRVNKLWLNLLGILAARVTGIAAVATLITLT